MGGSISFATVVLVVLSSTAAVSNRLGCVRETPLLSSQLMAARDKQMYL